MGELVGIDFGACNIKTARWRSKGAKAVSLSQNVDNIYIPNVVLYDMTQKGNLEKKIGDPAKDARDPENSVEHVKRKLEYSEWSKYIPNLQLDVSALDVATDIFAGISERLSKKLNCVINDLHAVITVPVCYSGQQKKQIYQAARAAGIVVEAVVTEPFAAMFSQKDLFDGEGDENVVIFDFGGSTLDLSLISIEHDDNTRIEELASAGLHYGGIDIDEAILSEIIEPKYSSEINAIKMNDDTIGQQKTDQELRNMVTTLKEKLFEDSDELSVTYTCTFYGSSEFYEFELTYQEMDDLFTRHDLKGKIVNLLDELLGQTDFTKNEITQVKIFGGTSRMKYVLDILSEYFGNDIFESDDYEWEDEIIADIAVGAANYLGICQQQNAPIEIICTTPFSLGIAQGNKFRKCIDYCPPYGRQSISFSLGWQDLKDNKCIVSVYRTFADSEFVEINGDNGAVFAGSVTVKPELYQATDAVLMKMELVNSNTLQMIFSEMREEEEVEVERKTVSLQ